MFKKMQSLPTINLPSEFGKRMSEMLGEEYDSFIEEYNRQNYQALRMNPLKRGLQPQMAQSILQKISSSESSAAAAVNAQPVPWAEHAYYYEESDTYRPGKHIYHEIGLYYIQEPSAMSAAALLHPAPGERVLDLCAAPGGKTTQLASYMNQNGLLVTNEIHPARCKILSQNVERMGIANAVVCNEDGAALAQRFPGFFHRILVDAPCSGEGMFRKNPAALEEWSPEHVRMCAARQKEILEYAAEMLMYGGTMVYSTCTFAPEENEQVIRDFLNRHPEFFLKPMEASWFSPACPEWAGDSASIQATAAADFFGAFRLWPHKLHGEGHFVAVLQKGSPLDENDQSSYVKEIAADLSGQSDFVKGKKANKSKKGNKGNLSKDEPDREQQALLRAFLEENLTEETAQKLLSGKLILFKDQLCMIPQEMPSLHGLKVARAGLELGAFRKNRFEPAHALALWLGQNQAKNVLNISSDSPQAKAWLRGETITGDANKGWCLVCIDGFSAGWGKAIGGVVKNHYPKGLRKFE